MQVRNVTESFEPFTCNAFLVTGARTALVDVGQVPGVVDVVREHVDDVDLVAVTHQHGDHVGQLDAVVEAFDPDVYAYADHPHRTHELADGDTLPLGDETADVVYTPGHADDHVSLVTPTSLFGGDVVVHDDGAFDDGSFGRTDAPGASRDRLVASIETLLDRLTDGVEHMYSGHGGEFHGDVHAVVERALARARRHDPKYPDE